MKLRYLFCYFTFLLAFIGSSVKYVKAIIDKNDISSDIALATVLICFLAIVLIGDKLTNKKQ